MRAADLNVSDDQIRLLVDSIQDYAIYLMAPDGTIRSWNLGAQRLKGYAPAEAIGNNFSMFFTPEDRANGKPGRLLAAALEHGRNEDTGWRVRKDGSQFWVDAIITALFDRAGQHVGFAKVTRDLTDRGYRAFVEAAHSIVWTSDASGRPSADSPTWRAHTGQTEDVWRAGRGWEAIHPEDLPAVRAAWEASRTSGQPLEIEFRLRDREGVYRWMAGRAIAFFDHAGAIREWFGVITEISKRKQAEAEREQAMELLQTTLRSIGDAVLATDTSGIVTFMNPITERLTGWTSEEAVGRHIHEMFPIFNEESGLPVENPVQKVLERGVIVGLANHTVLRRRDGTQIPIADSAAPIRNRRGELLGVVLVFRDVSEEKKTIDRRILLAKATEEITSAVDHRDALRRIATLACPRLADWVSVDIVDRTTGKLEQIAHVHRDPAMIQRATELLQLQPEPDTGGAVQRVIHTGQSELHETLPEGDQLQRLRALDLESVMLVPLRGHDETFGAITFACVRERLFTEEDLALAETLAARVSTLVERRRLEEEAALANRQKDEFLATISHELRTPLQAILGYATMLERNALPDPAKAIAVIIRNAQVQARLVEDMLDMSRILSGKLHLEIHSVELGAVIEAALDGVRPAATSREIEIELGIAPDLGKVRGDPGRLQQVVWNLASNAVKFTPRGGRVHVAAKRAGSNVEIIVRDTGKGIAREDLPVIFERFRQVDSSSTRSQGGLGLGLAIVRYIVEAHGGSVTAESAGLNTCSTFTVTLPAHVDDSAGAFRSTPSQGMAGLDDSTLAGIEILLVDDDDDAREAIADSLGSLGARVRQASTVAKALEMVSAEPPAILISDIGMPGEDGYSLVRKLRELGPREGGGVPAIALTAFARNEDATRAQAAGFDAYVAKPASVGSIVAAVLEAQNRRL